MGSTETVELTRAENLRSNLRRVFNDWGVQTRAAKDAGIHFVHLARIINGDVPNPTLGTIEAISIALEIPLETLLSRNPPDIDLRISKKATFSS